MNSISFRIIFTFVSPLPQQRNWLWLEWKYVNYYVIRTTTCTTQKLYKIKLASLGDNIYPLNNCLLKYYNFVKGRIINYRMSSSRCCMECAFKNIFLKWRFKWHHNQCSERRNQIVKISVFRKVIILHMETISDTRPTRCSAGVPIKNHAGIVISRETNRFTLDAMNVTQQCLKLPFGPAASVSFQETYLEITRIKILHLLKQYINQTWNTEFEFVNCIYY
jgi:hypothetical protein